MGSRSAFICAVNWQKCCEWFLVQIVMGALCCLSGIATMLCSISISIMLLVYILHKNRRHIYYKTIRVVTKAADVLIIPISTNYIGGDEGYAAL